MPDENESSQVRDDARDDTRVDARAPRRMSAMAVVALVLACLGRFYPALAAGFILGVMAKKEIEQARLPLKGRRVAIAAMVISLLWLGYYLTLFVVQYAVPEFKEHRQTQRAEGCRSNLESLWRAVEAYRAKNDMLYPPRLQVLVDSGLIDAGSIRCPATAGKFDSADVDRTGGYTYRAFTPPADLRTTPLVWDTAPRHEEASGPVVNVVYADGHVMFMPADDITASPLRP